MLDTNALIAVLGGEPEALRRHVSECELGEVGLSSIVFAEVAVGSWNGKRPPWDVLDQVTTRFEIAPFDHAAATMYARLPFKRGSFDRLIAAHALALGCTLVTNNTRHFADIPGLAVENWTQ
jgi:tRNA(fMet)-specific endonuclease VapC